MRLGHLLETILVVVMLAFTVMLLLGLLLLVEIINFIIGQQASPTMKVISFAYLAIICSVITYFAARKIYNLKRIW